MNDRIFSTSVNLSYTLNVSAIGGVDDLAQTEVEVQFDRVAASAKEITLEVFATDESASVQVRTSHLFVYYLASPARPCIASSARRGKLLPLLLLSCFHE